MTTPNTKRCPSCKTEKPATVEHFARNRGRPDGLNGECKLCSNKRGEKIRQKNLARNTPVDPFSRPTPPAATPPDFFDGFVKVSHEPAPAPTIQIDPLESARTNAATERAKRDLKSEHRALIGEVDRLNAEIDAMKAAVAAPSIIVYEKASWERGDAIPCALASDWHIEEPVTASDVHSLNEYNLEIARKRAVFFFQNFLRLADIMARDSHVRAIWIGFLGDFFSGFIHEELVATNLLAPGDAAKEVVGMLTSGIEFLLRESNYQILGDCLAGNHGRMTKQMWHGDPTGTSLESFMYHTVAARFHGNPRVQLNVADRAMVYRDFFERFRMRLIHGYEVKYGGGVGGITIPLNKALAQWDRPIQASLTALGHFHQRLSGPNYEINGSLIGYNTFAQAIKAGYEDPQQSFFLVHARKGGTRAITAPIWLDADHKSELKVSES